MAGNMIPPEKMRPPFDMLPPYEKFPERYTPEFLIENHRVDPYALLALASALDRTGFCVAGEYCPLAPVLMDQETYRSYLASRSDGSNSD